MSINLLNIKPNKVSRDLSGYITYIYGKPKTGKTTLASQIEGALLLAFEPGYRALPGVMVQDVTSWAEMKQVYRELKKTEVKDTFRAVIVDTIDIAAEKCQKYILDQNGIEDLGDLGYGKGWSKFKAEFNEIFRGLTQLGYTVVFLGHEKEITIKDANGNDKLVVRPALSSSARTVIAGMADIFGYAHQKKAGEMSVLTLRSPDGSIECGGRFKYLKAEIPMNYNALIDALREAIEKEAAEYNGQYVTDEKIAVPTEEDKKYDFDAMMKEFNEIVAKLMQQEQSNAAIITSIVEKYLGKGKKAGDCTPAQCEHLDLILIDLRDLLK